MHKNDNEVYYKKRIECVQVILDSRNGSCNNFPFNSDVTFSLNQSVYNLNETVLDINLSVLNFSIPNSIYNINEYNNLLSLSFNSTTINYGFAYGNYNSTTFMNTFLSIVDSTFKLTFNSISNVYTITNTTYDFVINTNSNIGEIMGFMNGTTYSSTSKSLVLPYCVNFNGLNSMNIHLENIHNDNIDSYYKSNSNIIKSINIKPYEPLILYEKKNESCKVNIDDEMAVNTFSIHLKDDLNRFINFNNKYFNITLLFEITKIEQVNFDSFYDKIKNFYIESLK